MINPFSEMEAEIDLRTSKVWEEEIKMNVEFDDVNRPEHYVKNGFEVIDIIEAWGLGYRLGNVIKYVLRHQDKGNPIKDLRKAQWYLSREIETLKNTRTENF